MGCAGSSADGGASERRRCKLSRFLHTLRSETVPGLPRSSIKMARDTPKSEPITPRISNHRNARFFDKNNCILGRVMKMRFSESYCSFFSVVLFHSFYPDKMYWSTQHAHRKFIVVLWIVFFGNASFDDKIQFWNRKSEHSGSWSPHFSIWLGRARFRLYRRRFLWVFCSVLSSYKSFALLHRPRSTSPQKLTFFTKCVTKNNQLLLNVGNVWPKFGTFDTFDMISFHRNVSCNILF